MKLRITILGGGTMGTVLLHAIVSFQQRWNIVVCDKNAQKLAELRKYFRMIETARDAADIIDTDILFLAIKPQEFPGIRLRLKKSTLVISVMAGVSMKAVAHRLGTEKVVRAMPNIPARVNKGFTGWTATKTVTIREKKLVKKILDAMGEHLYVRSEDMIDKITAVSGSGPAYLFYVLECFKDAAQALDLTEKEAEQATRKTFEGAAALLYKCGDQAKLIRSVASKGGTTAAALRVFKKNGMKKIWIEALKAAYRRSKELSRASDCADLF